MCALAEEHNNLCTRVQSPIHAPHPALAMRTSDQMLTDINPDLCDVSCAAAVGTFVLAALHRVADQVHVKGGG